MLVIGFLMGEFNKHISELGKLIGKKVKVTTRGQAEFEGYLVSMNYSSGQCIISIDGKKTFIGSVELIKEA